MILQLALDFALGAVALALLLCCLIVMRLGW